MEDARRPSESTELSFDGDELFEIVDDPQLGIEEDSRTFVFGECFGGWIYLG